MVTAQYCKIAGGMKDSGTDETHSNLPRTNHPSYLKAEQRNSRVTFNLSLQSTDLLFERSLRRLLCEQMSYLFLQLYLHSAHLGHFLLVLPRELLQTSRIMKQTE